MRICTVFLVYSALGIGVSSGFTAQQAPAVRRFQSRAISTKSISFQRPSPWALPVDTRLAALPVNTWPAATGLIASSLAGIVSERTILPPNAGILGTLFASAIMSNLGWVPATHILYDLCWTLVLPVSLSYLLLQKAPETSSKANADIPQVGLAFLLASCASFFGCTFSFFLCRWFPTLWFNPADAAVAAGCLCASYIGGSINFFATARTLLVQSQKPQQHATELLSSMAAADLLVMAMYLAWLSTALQSRGLLRLFGEEKKMAVIENIPEVDPSAQDDGPSTSRWSKVSATLLVSLLAGSMTVVANSVERLLSPIVSGTACAVIALLGAGVQRIASRQQQQVQQQERHSSSRLYNQCRNMQYAAQPMANISFQLFFAAVGMTANVGRALKTTGTASVMFSGTAIVTHVLATIMACRLWNSAIVLLWRGGDGAARATAGSTLKLRHILVASNAAIGGPATAAAFAGQQQTGLAVAATIWGVVGYGVGTNIGILATRWYQSML
ncbi:Protein of unknown function (DUF819) [Fragilaria crotonensis]|nr:Protein of unknown function (DUF819) [Fragilaria crotonensis]